jgi:hypothetical protein
MTACFETVRFAGKDSTMKALLTSLVLVVPMMLWGCSDDDGGGGSGGSGGSAATGGSGGSGGSGGMGGSGGAATEIPATSVVGVLTPYQDNVPGQDGSDLFPPSSVEAHWYQWLGRYVVLYRGYDATDMTPICPGNSIENAQGFSSITNDPYPSGSSACDGAPNIASAPGAGVFACGGLLYYVTEIATAVTGNLWGTLELSTSEGFIGQTTFGTPVDLDNTPVFEPGLTSYDLPADDIDNLDVVNCP